MFLAPITGLLAWLGGTSVVLLLYMLKLRRRPMFVSSTLLWSQTVKDMEGNVPWQRLSPTLLLFVHLLIVALLAMALARPVLDDAIGDGQHVYLVIDTSASMNAQADGRSGLERAKEMAIAKLDDLFDSGRSPRVSVIESANESRLVIDRSSQRGRLVGAVKSIEPTSQPGDIHQALELIQQRIEANQIDDDEDVSQDFSDALVWVFSDAGESQTELLPMRGGSGMFIPPFLPDVERGNIGIVAVGASRDRSDPVMCRVFVRLVKNQHGPKAAVARVLDGHTLVESRAVAFDDDEESVSTSFELRLMQSELLRIEIDVDDALDDDNRAWVRVPDPSPVRVVVVAPGGLADPLLVDMLGVIARSEPRVIEPTMPIGGADLVVYDRVSPERLVDLPTIGFASLLPHQPREDLLPRLGGRSVMNSWDRSDPMIRDAGLGSVSYQRSVGFADDTGLGVLASDHDGAVIVEYAHGAYRHVRIGFAIHDSNWAVQVGLPIFLVNAIEQLLPGASGVGDVFTTGEPIVWQGQHLGTVEQVGVIERVEPTIGVSLLNAKESMLGGRAQIGIGKPIDEGVRRFGGASQHQLWRWFVLAAVVLLSGEWFVYLQKVRV